MALVNVDVYVSMMKYPVWFHDNHNYQPYLFLVLKMVIWDCGRFHIHYRFVHNVGSKDIVTKHLVKIVYRP